MPDSGQAFSAAQVKECAGSGQTLTTDPTTWTAHFSENNDAAGREASQFDTPGPPLPAMDALGPGQCAVGWVVFARFADGVGESISVNGTSLSWTLR